MKKRIPISAISFLLAASLATPAFALFIDNAAERPSRRATVRAAEESARLHQLGDGQVRAAPSASRTGRHRLNRARINRNFRRLNRRPKEGTNRYRTLNRRIFPNTRSIRDDKGLGYELLPSTIVQTGGAEYAPPSRRSIRGNRDINGLNRR